MAGFKDGEIEASYTPYSTLCGGITSPGIIQEIAPGTANKVLTSNGPGAKATYQTPIASASNGDWTEIDSGSLPSASSFSITSGLGTAYEDYIINVVGGSTDASNNSIDYEFSDNAGSAYAVELRGCGITGQTTVFQPVEIEGTALNFGDTNGFTSSNTWNITFYLSGNKTNDWKLIYASDQSASIANNDCALWMCMATTINDIDAIRMTVNSSGSFDAGTYFIGGK